MYKTGILTSNDLGEQVTQIVPVSRVGVDRSWLKKQASVLGDKFAELKPRDGQTPIYSIAISAMEISGSNRNADFWPGTSGTKIASCPASASDGLIKIAEGLKERYKTFETHARMYRNHRNDDPSLASGIIHSAAYNEPMGRVEVLSYVDDDKWSDELNKLANHELTGVSMSASVPYDYCNICGNRAPSPRSYCDHIKNMKNAILEDGTQVGMINEKPTFVDLSAVTRNADRLGYALGRIALGEKEAATESTSSNPLREDKLRKFAEMEKKVVLPAAPGACRAFDGRVEEKIPDATIMIIRSHRPEDVMSGMKSRKIILPPEEFFRVLTGPDYKTIKPLMASVKQLLPRIFQILKADGGDLAAVGETAGGGNVALPSLSSALSELEPDYSLRPRMMQAKITLSISQHPKDAPSTKVKLPKTASVPARNLAKEYGKYLLACSRDEDANLVLLSNRVRGI